MRSGPRASKWVVFGIVAIGVFMGTLDGSIVNISLPVMARDFGVSLNGAIEWVLIAYLVTSAAALLTAGRLADMVGRKAVWIAGLALFTGSSALCGAAPSLPFLIGARAVQGLGGAMLFSTSPALLTEAFPPEERGRALGYNAITVALGTSIGPSLGGLITATLSWRWIFFVNLPFGIAGIVLTVPALAGDRRTSRQKFDPAGAALLAVGLASLVAALSFAVELGFSSPAIIVLSIVGSVALGFVPFAERRVSNPIIDFSLFRNRTFLSANASLTLSFLALFAVGFLMPFYLEELRGFPPLTAGLLLTPLPITLAIVAPMSGSIADKTGDTRVLTAVGLSVACLGLVLIGFLNEKSSVIDIVWRLVVVGIGQATFQAPNNSALLGAAPPSARGSASGFMATGRVIGQATSVALAGAVFAGLGGAAAGAGLAAGTGNIPALRSAFLVGFRSAMMACAAVAVLGVFASLVRTAGAKSR